MTNVESPRDLQLVRYLGRFAIDERCFRIEAPFEATRIDTQKQVVGETRSRRDRADMPRWSISCRYDLGLGEVALVRFASLPAAPPADSFSLSLLRSPADWLKLSAPLLPLHLPPSRNFLLLAIYFHRFAEEPLQGYISRPTDTCCIHSVHQWPAVFPYAPLRRWPKNPPPAGGPIGLATK